jgi:hypothetical protein
MRHIAADRVVLALAAACVLLVACKVKDPLYCDQTTPCTDEALPFCDLNGEYAASEGIKRTCIPYPWDAGPDTDAGPSCTPGEWVLDTIDDAKVNAWPTLAVDSAGTVHVAYAAGDPWVLHYAYGRPGAWTTEETPESGGFYPQIAIDSSDVIHLVHGAYPAGLRYLRKSVGEPQFDYELVAPKLAFDIGFDLDTSEMPVACFLDADGGGPAKCHVRTAEGWQAIDSPPAAGATSGISIAIDSANTLHFTADGLIYFSRTGDAWSGEETIDDNAAIYAPLAVDSDGVPHVAFVSTSAGDDHGNIVHAYRRGPDDWDQEIVERAVDGRDPSLFVDGQDTLHIAYVDVTNSNLKYAKREAGVWSTKTIDDTATIPWTPHIFVDKNGTPRIVYLDMNDEDLRYAYLCP